MLALHLIAPWRSSGRWKAITFHWTVLRFTSLNERCFW